MAPAPPPTQQRSILRRVLTHQQRHRFRTPGLLLQGITPFLRRPASRGDLARVGWQPSAERLHLLQPALLLLRQLQPSRKFQRVSRSSHKREQQRQLQPLGLEQTPNQTGISLQSRVQQPQSAPGLESEKSLRPWFA
jgi:hypothetical protein